MYINIEIRNIRRESAYNNIVTQLYMGFPTGGDMEDRSSPRFLFSYILVIHVLSTFGNPYALRFIM